MSEEFNSLTIAVLRNKVYDLKKSREENLKKLKELQNKTSSLSQKINEITPKNTILTTRKSRNRKH